MQLAQLNLEPLRNRIPFQQAFDVLELIEPKDAAVAADGLHDAGLVVLPMTGGMGDYEKAPVRVRAQALAAKYAVIEYFVRNGTFRGTFPGATA